LVHRARLARRGLLVSLVSRVPSDRRGHRDPQGRQARSGRLACPVSRGRRALLVDRRGFPDRQGQLVQSVPRTLSLVPVAHQVLLVSLAHLELKAQPESAAPWDLLAQRRQQDHQDRLVLRDQLARRR
jgi:hypothetical protein